MIIFPAIDIKDKKCVRLTQGDFDKVNVYGEDPSLMAKKWAGYGAEFIHVVNLNGSRDEVGINDETLAKVAKAVDVPIQVGGGIRDEKRVKELLDLGINRVIVGISKDGMLEGPNFDIYKELSQKTSLDIIASGGVTSIDDVKRLLDMNMYGAIIGKALYDNRIDLKEVLDLC